MVVLDNENVKLEKLEIDIAKTGHITNTYILKDKVTQKVAVVDPAYDADYIKSHIDGTLDCVIITHAHADHIAALAELVNETNARVYIYEKEVTALYDKTLNAEEKVGAKVLPVDESKLAIVQDGDIIQLGNISLEVIHTPGHTSGSMILLDKTNNVLFSGDTIFENSYGRTDLINGNHEEMGDSLKKIFSNLDNPKVFSGHGRDFYLRDSERKVLLLYSISM